MILTPRLIASVIQTQAKTQPRYAALLELTAYLGLRPEELRYLRPSHVEPGIAIRFTRAKRQTPQEERLPLPYALFVHTCALTKGHIIDGQANEAVWLFPGKDAAKPITTRSITNVVTRAFERCSLVGVNPRLLRHYTATRINQVASLPTAQHLLGHSTPLTTQLYLDSSFSALSSALTLAHTTDPTPTHLQEEQANEVVQDDESHPRNGLVSSTAQA